VNSYLNLDTTDEIYTYCNQFLCNDKFSARGLLLYYKAEMVCTTDDPCDNLSHHKKIAADKFNVKVPPGFRPDKIFNIANKQAFINYLQQLEQASDISITGFASVLEALQQRINYFHTAGCRIAGHGLSSMPSSVEFTTALGKELELFLSKKGAPAFSKPEQFAGAVLKELCKMYHRKD
jgi:glucuronate isomerase